MKRPYLLILLAALMLGLLIPAFYRGGAAAGRTGSGQAPAQVQKNTAAGPGDGAAGNRPDTTPKAPEQGSPVPVPSIGGGTQEASQETPARSGLQSAGGLTVSVAVVGADGGLLFGPADLGITINGSRSVNALDTLRATGLQYAMSTRFPELVAAVSGQKNQGQSGWMYKVNGVIPSAAAPDQAVKQGDRIIWWYSKSLDAPSPDWESLAGLK